MSLNFILLFVLLLGSAGFYGFWLLRENDRLQRQWQKQLGSEAASNLGALMRTRTIIALGVFAFSVVVILAYHWQYNTTKEQLSSVITEYTAQQENIVRLQAANSAATAEIEQLKAAAATSQQTGLTRNPASFYPSSETQLPVANTPSVAPITEERGGIESLYNPEDSTQGNQSAMDRIKKRYEDLFVNYMFLKKCGKSSEADYHIINSALSQEMASVNAPGRLQYDILTSAQGSYNEMYAQSDCDAPESEALLAQYKDYIAAISREFNAP